MNLWIGDYLKLRNEIHYLEFKLTDPQLTNQERTEAQKLLDERLFREGQFKVILSAFEDVENQILFARYVEGMTLDRVAEKLCLSGNYIKTKHAEIMKTLSKFEKIHTELERFKKHFSFRHSKSK